METLRWGFVNSDGSLPDGSYVYYGALTIDKARLTDSGTYICTDSETLQSSQPVNLTVNEMEVEEDVKYMNDNVQYNNNKQQQELGNYVAEDGRMWDEISANEYDENGNYNAKTNNHDYYINQDTNEYGNCLPIVFNLILIFFCLENFFFFLN